MSDSFDLTTRNGIRNASDKYGSKALGAITYTLFPQAYLVKKLYDWATSSTHTATTIQQQREAAVEVIRAGRENGAEEIELEMDQTAGLDLKGKLQSGETLETKIGKSGRMTLKVKYKQT